MNEILLAIFLPIILTGIAYSIAEILMKICSIKHPKNTFFVYLLVFILSFSFIPLTYMTSTNSASVNIDDSVSMKQEDLQNIDLQNFSIPPFSSKITPLRDVDTTDEKTKSIPLRFILEISWYDYDIREKNITSNNELTQDNNQNVDNINQETTPVSISFINYIDKMPPLLIVTLVLSLFASIFVFYQLFIGKKYYLKKINAHQSKNPYLLTLLHNLSKELHIKTPKIYSYNGSPNAFVIGYPATLVVSDRLLKVLTQNELKTTLRHELTHIKHHDVMLKAFIQATRVLYFYNPFVHLTAKKIFNKRELLADASYNISYGDKVSFMEALIKIAEYTQSLSKMKYKPAPIISVSLLELSSYHPTMTERFISLFNKCRKKTILTLMVSIIILMANGSAIFFTHSFISLSSESDGSSEEIVNVEKQYLVEDITYTTIYQNNQQYQGKMVHKTLYNIISLPNLSNDSNIREIINYIILKYYQNQYPSSAF